MSKLRNWQPEARAEDTAARRRAANENDVGVTLVPTADRPSAWLDGEPGGRRATPAAAPAGLPGQRHRPMAVVAVLMLVAAILLVGYFLAGPLAQILGAPGSIGVD